MDEANCQIIMDEGHVLTGVDVAHVRIVTNEGNVCIVMYECNG